MLKVRPTFRSL